MRKQIFTLAIVLFLCNGTIFSQYTHYSRSFPDRYKLDLPQEWNRPKLIQVITDILPQTIDELKGKDFCTDCDAGYTVMLVVDTPYIVSRNNISKGFSGKYKYLYTAQVIYRYRATLGVFDSTGRSVIELVLVSQSEEHAKRKDTSVSVSADMEFVRGPNGQVVFTKFNQTETPVVPPSNNLFPTLYELINTAEQRVYQIRDILAKLKN